MTRKMIMRLTDMGHTSFESYRDKTLAVYKRCNNEISCDEYYRVNSDTANKTMKIEVLNKYQNGPPKEILIVECI